MYKIGNKLLRKHNIQNQISFDFKQNVTLKLASFTKYIILTFANTFVPFVTILFTCRFRQFPELRLSHELISLLMKHFAFAKSHYTR